MTQRSDIGDKLIHFTRGHNWDDAFANLQQIVGERCIRGSGLRIRGAYSCVCFTEAPVRSLAQGLVNSAAYSRYMPFGVVFDKQFIFTQGGRPVIYQPEEEFYKLNEELRWRHVRYEPPTIDFTWEREWRLQTDKLNFDPSVSALVVPDESWVRYLQLEHAADQDIQVQQYSLILGDGISQMMRERFPWRIAVMA